MNPVKIALCLLLVAAPALSASHGQQRPRPENDVSYLSSHVESNKQDRHQQITRNNMQRLPTTLLDRAPNAADILFMPREDLMRLPVEQTVRTINDVCNAALSTDSIQPTYTPQREQIQMYLITQNEEISANLNQPQELLNHPQLKQGNNLTVFITGFLNQNSNGQNNVLERIKSAYRCRGNENLIVVDAAQQIDNVYFWASYDIERVGEWIGEALMEITKQVPVNKVHLVGHSVGAHLAGAAARRYTQATHNMVPRITGLDPAKLCYKQHQALNGLQKGDAQFVDIIHTSPYGLGQREPSADADFYPNGPQALQPGTQDLVSAHEQAVNYYAETVVPENEHNFMAQKCNSIQNLQTFKCQQEEIPMGIATPWNIKGNYFLETRTSSPYGQNGNGSQNSCYKY